MTRIKFREDPWLRRLTKSTIMQNYFRKIFSKEDEMKKLLAVVIGFGLLFALSNPVVSQTKTKGSKKPNVLRTEVYEITATVEKIDMKTRVVTLKGPDGNVFDVVVDKGAKNLGQVKPDDEVSIKYMESLGVQVFGPKEEIKDSSAEFVNLAPEGGKPGGYLVQVHQTTATVESIYYLDRIVSLKGPKGNVFTFKVAKDVKDLWHVKKGDQVVVKYTEALAISVDKPVK
jgi:hypothetical protein